MNFACPPPPPLPKLAPPPKSKSAMTRGGVGGSAVQAASEGVLISFEDSHDSVSASDPAASLSAAAAASPPSLSSAPVSSKLPDPCLQALSNYCRLLISSHSPPPSAAFSFANQVRHSPVMPLLIIDSFSRCSLHFSSPCTSPKRNVQLTCASCPYAFCPTLQVLRGAPCHSRMRLSAASLNRF